MSRMSLGVTSAPAKLPEGLGEVASVILLRGMGATWARKGIGLRAGRESVRQWS